MCATRSWSNIDVSKASGTIFARRSDGILFQLYVIQFDSISNFIHKLEEFRNCNCTKEVSCKKHKEMEKFG